MGGGNLLSFLLYAKNLLLELIIYGWYNTLKIQIGDNEEMLTRLHKGIMIGKSIPKQFFIPKFYY